MEDPARKQMIRQGFDTVAPGYDHPSMPFFPETARRMLTHLSLEPHLNLLDVCTGTGVVAISAAEQLVDGRVTGIDLSAGMLQQAKAKADQLKLENIDFQQMDLEHLELPAQSFDVATSSFGLFFLEDMTRALQNIVDTVKPGGRVAISTFTGDAFSPMADLFIRRYESCGREVPPLSWQRLASNELIEEQFRAAGISDVTVYHEPLGYQMTSSQSWWDIVWNAGWRGLVNQLSEDELKTFRQDHLEEIDQLIGDEGVWFNTEVLIAIGIKPR